MAKVTVDQAAHVHNIRKKGKPRLSKKNKYGLRRAGRKN